MTSQQTEQSPAGLTDITDHWHELTHGSNVGLTCKGWFSTGRPCTCVVDRKEAVGRGAAVMGGVLGKEGGLAAERGPEGRGDVPSGGRCLRVSCTSCLPATQTRIH